MDTFLSGLTVGLVLLVIVYLHMLRRLRTIERTTVARVTKELTRQLRELAAIHKDIKP